MGQSASSLMHAVAHSFDIMSHDVNYDASACRSIQWAAVGCEAGVPGAPAEHAGPQGQPAAAPAAPGGLALPAVARPGAPAPDAAPVLRLLLPLLPISWLQP